MRYVSVFGILFFLASPSTAQTILKQPSFPGDAGARQTYQVRDSRWGFVPRFNISLAERVRACGTSEGDEKSALLDIAPHRFGKASVDALATLKACDIELAAKMSTSGYVDAHTWRAIAPEAALPTILEKAKAIAFNGAGLAADYDSAFWNADMVREWGEAAREVFTWGPAKATVVDGCFIQKIIRSVSSKPDGRALLDSAFQSDAAALALLTQAQCDPAGRSFLLLAQDADRKVAFLKSFATLGASPLVRQIYDEIYLGENGPWLNRISAYHRLYIEAKLETTETDFAFFMELARGAPLPLAQLSERAKQIRESAPASPAQARRGVVKAMTFSSPAARQFATGRFASYFIDGMGENALSSEELSAWKAHSMVRASDVGLTETPLNICTVLPKLSSCK